MTHIMPTPSSSSGTRRRIAFVVGAALLVLGGATTLLLLLNGSGNEIQANRPADVGPSVCIPQISLRFNDDDDLRHAEHALRGDGEAALTNVATTEQIRQRNIQVARELREKGAVPPDGMVENQEPRPEMWIATWVRVDLTAYVDRIKQRLGDRVLRVHATNPCDASEVSGGAPSSMSGSRHAPRPLVR